MIWRARDAYRTQALLGWAFVVWIIVDLCKQQQFYAPPVAFVLVLGHVALVVGALVCVRWGLEALRRRVAARRWSWRHRRSHHG